MYDVQVAEGHSVASVEALVSGDELVIGDDVQ